jgi:hypothetical protein
MKVHFGSTAPAHASLTVPLPRRALERKDLVWFAPASRPLDPLCRARLDSVRSNPFEQLAWAGLILIAWTLLVVSFYQVM